MSHVPFGERIETAAVTVVTASILGACGWLGYSAFSSPDIDSNSPFPSEEEVSCAALNSDGDRIFTELSERVDFTDESSRNEFAFSTLAAANTLRENSPEVHARITDARSVEEVASVLTNYTSELGWNINIGEDAVYPEVFQQTIDEFPEAAIVATEADLELVKTTAAGIVEAISDTPIELLMYGQVESVSIFNAWNALGSAAEHIGTGGNDISMQLAYDKEQVRSVFWHEFGHGLHRLCGARVINGEYMLNNPEDFEYSHQNTTTTLNKKDSTYFSSDYSTVAIEEDVAEAYDALWSAGLILPGDRGYNDPIEQKKRLLASQLEGVVPGTFNFFVARGITNGA